MLLENYEEYARLARLYTSIHAKPKPKLKQGAISESTITLNISQRNTLAKNTNQKSQLSTTKPSLPPPLPPSVPSSKGTSGQDQVATSVAPTLLNENGVVGSSVAPTTAPSLETKNGALKAQAEKKKTDARKKSLKRL
uniref:Uncharacterized protein n=1 Tax=Opuntia streptacantha TaxID=393608 RepID=A0A7C9AZS7_OPUST